MPRLPRAATTLFANTLAYTLDNDLPSPTLTHASEPDGLGVIRSIRFDVGTGRWLAPLLMEIADPRVIAVIKGRKGLTVTFHAGTKADARDPFPLVDAALVLGLTGPAVPETRKVADLHHPLAPGEAP